jgi:hypothetical protein
MPAPKARIKIPRVKQTHYIRDDVYDAFRTKSHGNLTDATEASLVLWMATTADVRETALHAANWMPLGRAIEAVRRALADQKPDPIEAALGEARQERGGALKQARLPERRAASAGPRETKR